jgi:hypothetical protein
MTQVDSANGDKLWLLLIHQIPPKPDYLRVKIWRRLQSLGATPIKNSVYALPNTEQCQEDFQWVLREIVAGGGEGMVCEAHLVDGLSNNQVRDLFQRARNEDYAAILKQANELMKSSKRTAAGNGGGLNTSFTRLKRRFTEVSAIDFFSASARANAETALTKLQASARGTRTSSKVQKAPSLDTLQQYRDRTWVTRIGIHVDRMASAWLIRRFIDSDAHFKFVAQKDYIPDPVELRFDMYDAEFTHIGDQCTFEVLRKRFVPQDSALDPIAQIVHDIDLKDEKYKRQETPGIARLIAGIAMAYPDDEKRLARGEAVFEDLYQYFSRQGKTNKTNREPAARSQFSEGSRRLRTPKSRKG